MIAEDHVECSGFVRRRFSQDVLGRHIVHYAQRDRMWSLPTRLGHFGLPAIVLLCMVVCTPVVAQIAGTVTSSTTGEPLSKVLVMGEGLNWTETDAAGQYSLRPAKFRGRNARPEIPVSFRREGYRPLTRIALGENARINVALEDGRATEWAVPSCRELTRSALLCGEGLKARPRSSIGGEMRFWLPCGANQPEAYSDVDYGGSTVQFVSGKGNFQMQTMAGPTASSGHPYAEEYLNSQSFTERAIKVRDRTADGLDARGRSKDGTYWRWVGPLLAEFATYRGADAAAAKYFNAILDSACFQPMF
jgi:hypothetical protein